MGSLKEECQGLSTLLSCSSGKGGKVEAFYSEGEGKIEGIR